MPINVRSDANIYSPYHLRLCELWVYIKFQCLPELNRIQRLIQIFIGRTESNV